jgi:anti-sigma28 factor (negative regulator of flagellin synthesis)
MELTVKLEDNVDVSLLKKILNQIKGIKSVEVSDDDKTYSWEEIESSEKLKKVIEQSRNQIKNGNYQELTDDLLDEIFDGK